MNLTVHYQCITYLVTPSPEAIALRGHQVRVRKDAARRVTVRHQGTLLPIQPFVDKTPMVSQADNPPESAHPGGPGGGRCPS